MRIKFILSLFIAAPALANFTYYRTLTINASQVSTGTLTYSNFPALFQTTDVTLSTSASGGHLSTGYDLVFTTVTPTGSPGNLSCPFLLNWDTETVNTTGLQQDNVWINVPNISSATNTTLYACYGNPAITSYQAISSATWNNGYLSVQHFSSNFSTGSFSDSALATSTITWTANGTPVESTGTVDGGVTFDGNNSYYQYDPDPATWNSNLTLSAWINPKNLTIQKLVIVVGNILLQDQGFSIFTSLNAPGSVDLYFGGSDFNSTAGGVLSVGTPYYLVATLTPPGILNTNAKLYINGVSQTFSVVASGTQNITNALNYIGGFAPTSDMFVGMIDETRVSLVARSSDWILTEYNNQNSPATFMTIGPEIGPLKINIQMSGKSMFRGKAVLF